MGLELIVIPISAREIAGDILIYDLLLNIKNKPICIIIFSIDNIFILFLILGIIIKMEGGESGSMDEKGDHFVSEDLMKTAKSELQLDNQEDHGVANNLAYSLKESVALSATDEHVEQKYQVTDECNVQDEISNMDASNGEAFSEASKDLNLKEEMDNTDNDTDQQSRNVEDFMQGGVEESMEVDENMATNGGEIPVQDDGGSGMTNEFSLVCSYLRYI